MYAIDSRARSQTELSYCRTQAKWWILVGTPWLQNTGKQLFGFSVTRSALTQPQIVIQGNINMNSKQAVSKARNYRD
jgi:hypothetical protein